MRQRCFYRRSEGTVMNKWLGTETGGTKQGHTFLRLAVVGHGKKPSMHGSIVSAI